MALCIFNVRRVRSDDAPIWESFPEFTLNKINVSERAEIGKHPLHKVGNAGSVGLKYRLGCSLSRKSKKGRCWQC